MKCAACIAPLLLLAACAGAPASPPAAAATAPKFPQASRPVPADGFELRMRRGACYGRCPVYEVVLHADAAVDYSGDGGTPSHRRHLKTLGSSGSRIRRPDHTQHATTATNPRATAIWPPEVS